MVQQCHVLVRGCHYQNRILSTNVIDNKLRNRSELRNNGIHILRKGGTLKDGGEKDDKH